MAIKIKKLIISCALFFSMPVMANELMTETWEFPHYEEFIVRQNQLLIYCQANMHRCPAGLAQSRSGFGGTGSNGLYSPNSSATANNTSVVIAGDNNTLTLSTQQSSENDDLSSDVSGEAVIDNQDILNLGL